MKKLIIALTLVLCLFAARANGGEYMTLAGCLTCTNGVHVSFNSDVQVQDATTFLGTIVNTSDLTLSGGVGALTFTATDSSIVLPDNDASALDIGSPGDTSIMRFDTTDSVTQVIIGGTIRGTGTAAWFSVVAAANQACNTTCTAPCIFGVNNAATEADIVACTDATADECLCAGPS